MWVVAWQENRQPMWAVRTEWQAALRWALLMHRRWGGRPCVVHTSRWQR